MIKTATDPVCEMKIDPAKAAATSEYEGTAYYFCAISCKTTFDKDPRSFATKETRGCCHSSCCSA